MVGAEAKGSDAGVVDHSAVSPNQIDARGVSRVGDGNFVFNSVDVQAEVLIAFNILNRMTELGRPESFAIGA